MVASRLTDPARGALSDDVDDASANNCQLGEYRDSETFRQRVIEHGIRCDSLPHMDSMESMEGDDTGWTIAPHQLPRYRSPSQRVSSNQSVAIIILHQRSIDTKDCHNASHDSSICLRIRLPGKGVTEDCQGARAEER